MQASDNSTNANTIYMRTYINKPTVHTGIRLYIAQTLEMYNIEVQQSTGYSDEVDEIRHLDLYTLTHGFTGLAFAADSIRMAPHPLGTGHVPMDRYSIQKCA